MKTLILLLSLASSLILIGQEKPEVIKTELLTLSINGDVGGYYYRNGKGMEMLQASSDGISVPIYYEGSPVLFLYHKKADLAPVAKGQKAPEPALKVSVASGANRTLLIFAFGGDPDTPPKVKAYGITDTAFSEGDYRVYNFASQNVYIALNDEKLAVAPGKLGNVRGGSWGKKIQDMRVQLGRKDGSKIVPVYSSMWGHRPERRNFIFVFDRNHERKPFDIKRFYDLPSYKPKPRDGSDDPASRKGFDEF